jgi:hypothetical protein
VGIPSALAGGHGQLRTVVCFEKVTVPATREIAARA